MKKLLSILLAMAMTCSIMATSSFALGKNKVFRNEHGYKTYLVSSDKIDDYIKSLEIDKKSAGKSTTIGTAKVQKVLGKLILWHFHP